MKIKTKYNIVNNSDELLNTDSVFHKVTQLAENEYNLVLSGDTIIRLWDSKRLVYFTETQRGTKHKRNKKGETIEVPIISDKNIKEMCDLIIHGRFETSQLTFNVLDDDCKALEFTNGSLYIHKQISILDGAHRVLALYMAMEKARILNDELLIKKIKHLNFPIKLCHYNIDRARTAFSQFSLGLKLNKSRVESFNSHEASNRIINKLNSDGELKDMIDLTKTSISKTNDNLYAFNTFNEALKSQFIIQDKREETNIYNFLNLFFKELFNVFPELSDVELRRESKEYSLICENMTIYPLMSIANDLYVRRFNNRWKGEIELLEKIEWDKDNPIWESIMRVNGDKYTIVNNKNTRGIYCKIVKEEFYKNIK